MCFIICVLSTLLKSFFLLYICSIERDRATRFSIPNFSLNSPSWSHSCQRHKQCRHYHCQWHRLSLHNWHQWQLLGLLVLGCYWPVRHNLNVIVDTRDACFTDLVVTDNACFTGIVDNGNYHMKSLKLFQSMFIETRRKCDEKRCEKSRVIFLFSVVSCIYIVTIHLECTP